MNRFYSSTFLVLGNTRLSTTPTTAASPMPDIANEPDESTAPPRPIVSITDMMMTLRVSFMSTLCCIRFCTPTLAIVPNSNSMMPPSTACGIDCSSALSLPMIEKQMAVAAEMRITAEDAKPSDRRCVLRQAM